MKSALASVLILAIFGSVMTHHHHHHHNRRLGGKPNKPAYDDDSDDCDGNGGNFNFEAINNASLDQSATSGHSLAVGKGETRISSSIGNNGSINNVHASKGGQSASDWSQVGLSAASSTAVKKDKNGNKKQIQNASGNNWGAKAASQSAFLGQGAASTGLGVNGVVADVYGKEGAANANSFDSVLKAQASSSAVKQSGKNAHYYRRLNGKPAQVDDKWGNFNFDSINNASLDQSATSGHTMAVGKGNTHISSSIGAAGSINNIKAAKGGQAASDWSQVGNNQASSSAVKKDKHGNSHAINKASNDNYGTKGASQSAFLGEGNASTGIGNNGVVADVYGKDGAANANSFDSVLKNQASASAVKQAGKKNHWNNNDDEDSCTDARKHHKKNNKKDHKKRPVGVAK